MAFGVPWGTSFYSGGGASSLVPSRYHVAIGGRPYRLDTSDGPGWARDDIPVQRAQADTNDNPSEATLSTEGLWRRTVQSWHLGSGQEFYDRAESSPFRFDTSTGIDPWTRYRLGLLHDTARTLTTTEDGLYLAVAAGRLYVTDGQVVRFTTDGATWTAVTGNPMETALSITTDGSTVYVAYGPSGVYAIDAAGTAMASFATGTASAVGYAKGRLLVLETSGSSPRVFNVTATGAVTDGTLLLTVPDLVVPPGQWTAEGGSSLYLIGAVGDKTRIWRTAVKDDGTELDLPVVAGVLPDGQLARSIVAYQNTVVTVGTDDRVFVLTISDGDGNLTTVGNFEVEGPCYAFEPQDRYVWYGGQADATLGRIDLASDVTDEAGNFTPARAADLAADQPGDVRSVATFGGVRVFTVEGQGVYVEDTDPVASGSMAQGFIGFGIGDLKNALYADVRHLPLAPGDSVTVEVAKDGGPYAVAGISAEPGAVSKSVSLGQLLAETVSIRLTLAGNPTVTMVTVRAVPAPKVGERLRLRLQLFHKGEDLGGQPFVLDVPGELAFLRRLRESKTAVTVQLGSESVTAVLDAVTRFTPHSEARATNGSWTGFWNGTADLDFKIVTM